jgi:predicted RNA binding protein YcfA (HicA-like mRNA interferase family)
MSRLPRLKGKELVRLLEKAGFEIVRTRGSHVFLRHADGRVTTVPVHSGEIIDPDFSVPFFVILNCRRRTCFGAAERLAVLVLLGRK